MSKQSSKRHSKIGNSLCKSLDHDWMTTTADNYRVCKREDCPAAERLVHGTWVAVTQRQKARVASLLQSAKPLALWDDRTMLVHGIHPRQSEIEREAEQRYYRFVR